MIMNENLFLSFYNDKSKRHAVVEDNGLTAWLYLHLPSNSPKLTGNVYADAFIFNRESLIDISEVKFYKPNPPPITMKHGHDISICKSPTNHSWSINWSTDGESILLFKDSTPWCFIAKGDSRGYSKAVKNDGPWGHPWNEIKFNSIF